MTASEPFDYLIDEPDDDEPEPYTAEDYAADMADEEYHRRVENGYEDER